MGGILIETSMVLLLLSGYYALWQIRKRRMIKQIAIDPEVIYTDSRPSQRFFSFLTKVLSVSLVSIILLHSTNTVAFSEIGFLTGSIFNLIGFLIGILGLSLCWRAQNEMGASWRVGIDINNVTELVTTGVFKKIRNPTYSGLFLICAGAYLVIPITPVMVWALVFYIAIEFQVRIEEEFLSQKHGKAYRDYFNRTKRYLPFLY